MAKPCSKMTQKISAIIAGAVFLTLSATAEEALVKKEMPWAKPAYEEVIPATMPTSRPEKGKTGWTLWMKHHEQRCRWVAEKEVNLLMIGDSIVFRWDRVGRPVWDQFYGKRKAVNIGSSGDRTKHMLWHFQNGGLAGMKDKNPKVVLMMIGTNNRGIPELQGYDTAYGILALLKEIHAQLPESKILLLPIFPRGDSPKDPGRQRNEQINQIIKTYVDGETVHWLDLRQVFLKEDGSLNRELMPDGLHPGKEGFVAWAKAMEPTIQKMLGEAP